MRAILRQHWAGTRRNPLKHSKLFIIAVVVLLFGAAGTCDFLTLRLKDSYKSPERSSVVAGGHRFALFLG